MTRWLYLCNDLGIPLDGAKGASGHVRAVTRALCRAGLDVSVLAPRGRLPADHPARRLDNPAGVESRKLADRLRDWLAAHDQPAGLASEIGHLVYDAALDDAVQRDGFLPDIDVIVERLSLFGSTGGRLARRLNVPHLIEMNAPLAQEAAAYRDAGIRNLAQRIEQSTLSAADLVMTVSDELRSHVIAHHDLRPDRVVTVPNGVDLDVFAPPRNPAAARREAGLPDDALVFGFVGSLKPWHGVQTLLESFQQVLAVHARARLLVVGGGRHIDDFRAQARKLGVAAAVTFHGETDEAGVARMLGAMDVAVAPYLPQDTFYFSPLKLFEYMAAGRCVIASRAGQIADVIDHGRNGLLFTAGNVAELANLMIDVGGDPARRARLGEQALQSVQGRGWDAVARRIIELAGEVADRRAAAGVEAVHGAV